MEMILNMLTLDETEREEFSRLVSPEEQRFFPEGKESPDKEDYEQATIILGNPPAAALKDCQRLKLLHTRSAGVDQYSAPGVLPDGAVLLSASGAYGHSVSEHMFAMLLGCMKRLPGYRDQQRTGCWSDLGPVKTLKDALVLCVGTGDLGSSFAKQCKALGARTAGVRRDAGKPAEGIDEMFPFDQLDNLLSRADVVALMLPGGAATNKLMGRERIMKMKNDAILLNGGRGSIIDNDALAEIMDTGHLWGACLDVTAPEPLPPEHPLWKQPRAVITPHVAGAYHLEETPHLIAEIVLRHVRDFLRKTE